MRLEVNGLTPIAVYTTSKGMIQSSYTQGRNWGRGLGSEGEKFGRSGRQNGQQGDCFKFKKKIKCSKL